MAPADWVTISKSKKSSKHREWHNLSYKDGSYWIASKKASIVIGSRGFCIAVIRQTYAARPLQMRSVSVVLFAVPLGCLTGPKLRSQSMMKMARISVN